MPKKFSDIDKRKWLELYENGKTEKGIANRIKADYRTVKRGIDDARKQRDARLASIELIKEALRKHQNKLLEELDQIVSETTPPPEDFGVLSWHHNGYSIFDTPGDITKKVQLSDSASSKEDVERQMLRNLLRQHLKSDRLWKLLAEWQRTYSDDRVARIDFQRRMVEAVEVTTGLKLNDQIKANSPGIYSYILGPLYYQSILRKAFHPDTQLALKEEIVSDVTRGTVSYRHNILAEAPGNEEKTRQALINVLDTLQALPEVEQVTAIYQRLLEITLRLRQSAEQIKLLGIIPGKCDICSRLGM